MGRRKLWTGKRLRQISAELAQLGIGVCPNTVRRLLRQLDYGLHANAKRLSAECPGRDEQFTYMAEEKRQFLQRGLPIISVDTKKKERIGNYKNPGQVRSQQATPVSDHDFRSQDWAGQRRGKCHGHFSVLAVHFRPSWLQIHRLISAAWTTDFERC